jgi:transmembrane sensor
MSKLRAPIRDILDDRLPEADVQRLWRSLQRQTSRQSITRSWAMPLMAAMVLTLLGVVGWLGLRSTPAPVALVIAGADGLNPSRVLDGDVASVWALNDGSRIQLAGASRIEVLENNGQAFTMRLESGRGDFEVKPGGPRRWRIECGEPSVEVVGTSFVIDRDAWGVRVDVRHGVVRVRSKRIAGGVQRLKAGEHVYLPSAPQAEQAAAAHGEAATAASAGQAVRTSVRQADAPPTPIAQVASTPPHVANTPPQRTAAAPRGGALESDERAKLLRRADQARRSGRIAQAEALLDRVREGWPGTPHAAIASLTLARMRIAAAPERAAADLETALAAELPQGLREDAMARLVEAHARAGQVELAERAAQAYRRAFPDGRRAAEIERWTKRL